MSQHDERDLSHIAREQAPATSHSPLPWSRAISLSVGAPAPNYVVSAKGRAVFAPERRMEMWPVCSFADAEFIVLAVNHHHELVEACRTALEVIDFCLPYIVNEQDTRVVAEQKLRAVLAKVHP